MQRQCSGAQGAQLLATASLSPVSKASLLAELQEVGRDPSLAPPVLRYENGRPGEGASWSTPGMWRMAGLLQTLSLSQASP